MKHKIKISIPGKETEDCQLLLTTNYALVIGNKLYVNPEGYTGEVKILDIPEHKTEYPKFDMIASKLIPDGYLGILNGTQPGFQLFKAW